MKTVACGGVAPLGNGADHSLRGRALPQTPWDALKRHNSCNTTLAGWVTDESARGRYVEAFERSNFESMLSYYKANFPSTTQAADTVTLPKVQCPVLMFHGLDDQALLPGALNGTWEWLESDLTLVTIPGAGHFVQQDASEVVSQTMRDWLGRRAR